LSLDIPNSFLRNALYSFLISFYGLTALVGQGLLIVAIPRSYSDTPYLLGVPWTSDRPDFTCT